MKQQDQKRDDGPLLLGDGQHNGAVWELREEHARLLDEIEGLRQEQRKLKEGTDRTKAEKAPDGEAEQNKPEPKEPAQRRAAHWASTHPLAILAMFAGLVVLVIASIFLWRYLQSYESTDDAEVSGHIDQIGSRIPGTIVGVYVENSQAVRKGQVLVDLDPRDYQVSLEQAKANLLQAQANIESQSPNVPIATTTQATQVATAEQGVVGAEAAVASAERTYESSLADLRQAEADATNAHVDELRYRELVNKDEVSRQVYDRQLTAATAQDALVASRRAVGQANLKVVDQRRAELSQARQRAEEARANQPRQIAIQRAGTVNRQAGARAALAQVHQAALNLSYTKILAPVDGIVGDKTAEVGMQVAAGQEMLAITQIQDIWVTANFKETQIRRMRAGQSVTIHVDSLGEDFDGYIENMPGATGAEFSLLPPENATGNYIKVVQRLPVRIRFRSGQKDEARLRPGMSVEPQVWLR